MADFESWNAYGEFAFKVRRKARHILDNQSKRFLDALLETSQKRRTVAKQGSALWRAQLGHEWRSEEIDEETETEIEVECAFSPARMTPLPDRATEGRVNPKGIPCLYLCTDMNTAMSEVRPWIGSYISVAQFVLLKDLSLIDCSSDKSLGIIFWPGEEPDPAKREIEVWGEVNRGFSQPVTPTDSVADYAPTQVLAEAFRSYGYDGIVYRSMLGEGKNVALFDLSHAELVNCTLHRVNGVKFDFSQADNTYYMVKHYPQVQKSVSAKSDKEEAGVETVQAFNEPLAIVEDEANGSETP
jgi:hypothetical protein